MFRSVKGMIKWTSIVFVIVATSLIKSASASDEDRSSGSTVITSISQISYDEPQRNIMHYHLLCSWAYDKLSNKLMSDSHFTKATTLAKHLSLDESTFYFNYGRTEYLLEVNALQLEPQLHEMPFYIKKYANNQKGIYHYLVENTYYCEKI